MSLASSYRRYFFRCEQTTGDMENKASGGALATKNAGFLDATLWAAAGYATVGGGASNFCSLPAADAALDHINNTIVITARVLKATAALPGSEEYVVAGYAWICDWRHHPGRPDGRIGAALRQRHRQHDG